MIPWKLGLVRLSYLLAWLLATWLPPQLCARADDFSPKASINVSLAKPMTSIVDGRPFREGLKRIADEARVNVWLDRRVDPSQVVEVGAVGPTVYAALEKLAASQGCVVAVNDNVLLVGRAAWVDRTLGSLLSIQKPSQARAATFAWEDLTEPDEALRKVGGESIDGKLPHDLWPSTRLAAVTPEVATVLILAQFDLQPAFADSTTLRFRTLPAVTPTAVTRSYFPGGRATEIRSALARWDPRHRIEVTGNQLRIDATPEAHRRLAAMLLQSQQAKGPDPDRDTFTVRKMSTSAANALQQLAASAGKRCVIEPSAEAACQQRVTVEGTDVTLRELIETVARQAGVRAIWQNDSIVVTK